MNYLRCRRMWNYTSFNRMSLTTAMSRPHFMLGSCVHGALEDWLVDPSTNLTENYEVRSLSAAKQSIDGYTSLVGANPSPSELVPMMEALSMGKAMMVNYQNHYGTPIDFKQYHSIQTEQTLSIAIPNSYGKCPNCNGTGVDPIKSTGQYGQGNNFLYEVPCSECGGSKRVQNYLEATLDGIIADKRDRLLVLEHKTYNSRPRKDSLETNFQFIAYMWALTQVDMGPVLGIAYDGMWKRDGSLKAHTPSELFYRTILTRNKFELAEFEIELSKIVNEMSDDPYITHTVPWNGCWDCSFNTLCKAESRHEGFQNMLNSRYIKRERTTAFLDDEE